MESAVERYLNQRIEKLGGLSYKWTSPQRRGVPDRIVIYAGMVWFVEVKSPRGVMSPEQQREMNRLIEQGMNTSIIYGKGAVDTFINGLQQIAEENKQKKVSFLK